MVLHLAAAVADLVDPPLRLIHRKPSSRLRAYVTTEESSQTREMGMRRSMVRGIITDAPVGSQ